MTDELLIDQAVSEEDVHYESFGWRDWRKYPRVKCQHRCTFGPSQVLTGGSRAVCSKLARAAHPRTATSARSGYAPKHDRSDRDECVRSQSMSKGATYSSLACLQPRFDVSSQSVPRYYARSGNDDFSHSMGWLIASVATRDFALRSTHRSSHQR
jgi:hypothetical protein